MSETRRRIRAVASATDATVLGFMLEADVQPGASARFDGPGGPGGAPLADALFAIDGVQRVEVAGPAIWVQKAEAAQWPALKPAIAAAIREVLDATDAPLGAQDTDPATDLRRAVEDILERQINPSVAAHGGHIAAERVEGTTVYLRMSGGCQGCAASAATLREGVERMLRAALPQITDIVDLTDHEAGENPFYTRKDATSPLLHRPIPPGVIGWQGDQVTVDPDYLAPKLGLSPDTLRAGLRNGDVVGVTETGSGDDAGRTRIILRTTTRAWAAEVLTDGTAREIPPPRESAEAAGHERKLARQVRAHLQALPEASVPITYGALARALGLWMPGSVRRVTRALETCMREDAAAGRPFIAALVAGRGRDGLPAPGFFELAQTLERGPAEDEDPAAFIVRERARLMRSDAA